MKEKRRYGFIENSDVNEKGDAEAEQCEATQTEQLDSQLSDVADYEPQVKMIGSSKTSRKVHFIKTSDSPARSSVESVRGEPQSGRDSGIEVCFDNPEWMNISSEIVDRL